MIVNSDFVLEPFVSSRKHLITRWQRVWDALNATHCVLLNFNFNHLLRFYEQLISILSSRYMKIKFVDKLNENLLCKRLSQVSWRLSTYIFTFLPITVHKSEKLWRKLKVFQYPDDDIFRVLVFSRFSNVDLENLLTFLAIVSVLLNRWIWLNHKKRAEKKY